MVSLLGKEKATALLRARRSLCLQPSAGDLGMGMSLFPESGPLTALIWCDPWSMYTLPNKWACTCVLTHSCMSEHSYGQEAHRRGCAGYCCAFFKAVSGWLVWVYRSVCVGASLRRNNWLFNFWGFWGYCAFATFPLVLSPLPCMGTVGRFLVLTLLRSEQAGRLRSWPVLWDLEPHDLTGWGGTLELCSGNRRPHFPWGAFSHQVLILTLLCWSPPSVHATVELLGSYTVWGCPSLALPPGYLGSYFLIQLQFQTSPPSDLL